MSVESRVISLHKPPRLSIQTKLITSPQWCLSAIYKSGEEDMSPTSINTILNAHAFAKENGSPRPKSSFRSNETQYLDLFSTNLGILPSNTHRENKINQITTNSVIVKSSNLTGSDKTCTAAPSRSDISPNTLHLSQSQCRLAQHQAVPKIKPHVIQGILRTSSHPASLQTLSTGSSRARTRPKKHVGYKDPLTQTISTIKYVMSHIDLLTELSSCSIKDSSIKISDETIISTVKSEAHDKSNVAQSSRTPEDSAQKLQNCDLEMTKVRKRKYWEITTKWEWTINTTEIDCAHKKSFQDGSINSIKNRSEKKINSHGQISRN